MSLTFDGPATIASSGVVDYRGDSPALKMSVEGAYGTGSTSEMILVDKKMYLQVAGKNAKYLEIDLSDPDNPLAKSMGDMSAIDPRATIEAFTENVEERPQDRLRGHRRHPDHALRAGRGHPGAAATSSARGPTSRSR